MSDNEWCCTTNKIEDSCKEVKMDCTCFWEKCQEEAIKKVVNFKEGSKTKCELERGYEARARRIAAAYANIYLENAIKGNKDLIGRYHWMGLGAFASKTIAMIFNDPLVIYGNKSTFVTEATERFGMGSLWLHMVLSPWHYAWNISKKSFKSCIDDRNASKFTRIKNTLDNVRWSYEALPLVNNFKVRPEIETAFLDTLCDIEAIFENKTKDLDERYKASAKFLLKHLRTLLVYEQEHILQKLVWEKCQSKVGSYMSKYTPIFTPNSALVLSSDYDIEAVKKVDGQYHGRLKEYLENLPENEKAYSEPLEGTTAHIYESRKEWMDDAADQYHRLMLDDNGRALLLNELGIIATWEDAKGNLSSISDPIQEVFYGPGGMVDYNPVSPPELTIDTECDH